MKLLFIVKEWRLESTIVKQDQGSIMQDRTVTLSRHLVNRDLIMENLRFKSQRHDQILKKLRRSNLQSTDKLAGLQHQVVMKECSRSLQLLAEVGSSSTYSDYASSRKSCEYHLYRNNLHRRFDDLGLAWECFYLLGFHSIFICWTLHVYMYLKYICFIVYLWLNLYWILTK